MDCAGVRIPPVRRSNHPAVPVASRLELFNQSPWPPWMGQQRGLRSSPFLTCAETNHETREAPELLYAHAEWLRALLTHTREIEPIDEAFLTASLERRAVGKMIVRP
jgi:hypothetical protein